MTKEELYRLVDWSKLSRDYRIESIKKISYHKYNFLPTKEDLIYLYIDLNLDIKSIQLLLGEISFQYVYGLIKKFEIVKNKDLQK